MKKATLLRKTRQALSGVRALLGKTQAGLPEYSQALAPLKPLQKEFEKLGQHDVSESLDSVVVLFGQLAYNREAQTRPPVLDAAKGQNRAPQKPPAGRRDHYFENTYHDSGEPSQYLVQRPVPPPPPDPKDFPVASERLEEWVQDIRSQLPAKKRVPGRDLFLDSLARADYYLDLWEQAE